MSIEIYADPGNVPAPVVSGTTVQSFVDVDGEVWIAKNGVSTGAWKRARDVLYALIINSAGYTTLVSPGGIVPYSAVSRDLYGQATGTPNWGLTAPINGLYRVTASLICTANTANGYAQGQIQRTVLPSTVTNITSDNMVSAISSGPLGWRSGCLVFLNATDYVNVKLYQSPSAAAIFTSVPLGNRLELAYVGSG